MSYHHLSRLFLYLWISPHLLLLPLAVVILRKKLHKQYPIFFSYLLFNLVQFCVVFTMSGLKVPAALYLKVDLVGRIGDAVLSFGIIQELFAAALVGLGPMRSQMGRVLRWLTLALVVLSSVFIWILCYSSLHPAALPGYWSIEALEGAQCGLLFLVFLWHRFLGVRVPAFSFGIALGMGMVAAFDLFMLAMKTLIVLRNEVTADLLNMAAFHAAVLIWLGFALVRENATLNSRASLPQLHEHAAELGRAAHL